MNVEICILAGGLSSRMGRDKARLRLGRFTLLGRIRAVARSLGLPVRVIRRDLVPRCGPLGGVYTALKRTRCEAVLFLSCDMPLISADLLRWFLEKTNGLKPVFMLEKELAGFPFMARAEDLPVVTQQMEMKRFSLQALAKAMAAKLIRCPAKYSGELMNVNTPEDWEAAREVWRHLAKTRA